MEGHSFWLIYIQENHASVSLISSSEGKFRVVAMGPTKDWPFEDSELLVASVDESLSVCSLNANITEDQEPSTAAFVVPPFWVGSDGKITPQKIKFIKEICKKLSLTPTGFLAEDEALVEDSNKSDGFPSSFILVHLTQSDFYLSLVYLGHIRERIKKDFSGEFTGQLLESALLEIKTESTLPPQIIIFGSVGPEIITSLKNYPWIGKKNVETFLHLPDINFYGTNDLITTFTRVISSQLVRNVPISKPQEEIDLPTETQNIDTVDQVEAEVSASKLELSETEPEALGFNLVQDQISKDEITEEIITTSQIPEPNLDPFEPSIILPPVLPQELKKHQISFDFFKKIKFPKGKINFNIFWIILIILPILSAIPFVLGSADITLFVNPYRFDKTVNVTLKADESTAEVTSSIIPVEKKTFNVDVKSSVEATGQKTVGERSKGEIIIYNKLDKAQNIPKGSILTDPSGKKFELTAAVSVASSSSDLNQGIITLGQTKTIAMAADIGPEFNLTSGSQLSFKDFPSTSIIAKVNSDFSGGSRQQIRAVSQEDKSKILSSIDNEINKAVETKISQTLDNSDGAIKETIQSNKGNLDLSREIGEAAEELSGSVTASVSVFTFSPETKEKILKYFLANETDFDKIVLDPDAFSFNVKVNKISANQAEVSLTITGKSQPTIDTAFIQKTLSLKTVNQAGSVIKKIIPRAYNFRIGTKLPLLPLNPKNIHIEVKTESL